MWTKRDMANAHDMELNVQNGADWALAYATMRQAEALEELALQVAHLGWSYGHGSPGAAQYLAQAVMGLGKGRAKP